MLDLAQSLLVCLCLSLSVSSFPNFLRPNVTFNHMAYDPGSGFIYVGAVNWIFQLSPDLQLLAEDSTGPVLDSPECLPFKELKDCPQASYTHNSNKLLTVNTHGGELLTCGHVFQGICEKRNLTNISNIIYRTEDPGDNQFVAANDPKVTTVGIVERTQHADHLFVGRGLTARLSSGIPPITIRQLEKPSVFSNEGLGKLVVGDFSDYNNTFVGVFSNEGHVYFLFYRRGSKSQMDYKTYLGSVCSTDIHLYSYVEVPLVCEGYNLAQAAHLETKNRELFVVFSASQGPIPSPSSRTALCSFKMKDIEDRIEKARVLCYTELGKGESQEEAGIEYGVNSKCAALPKESPKNFPCGGDHTPSPIASRVPVIASPLLTNDSSLTAVAALLEGSHTVVFLGDAGGSIHKVFVSSDTGQVYKSLMVAPGSPVSPDLVLDTSGRLLYVMTESKVTRLPVAECSSFPSCDSCLGAGDPFCGWCVLQGRCAEKQQCADSNEANHWLWSFDHQTQCVSIQGLLPANQSRHEQTEVSMTIVNFPAGAEQETWKCLFDDWSSPAHVYGDKVSCTSPPPEELPPNQQDKVVCSACVSSPWRCYWCLSDYLCSHTPQCSQEQAIIYSQNDEPKILWGPESCPRVEKVGGSHLIHVGLEGELDLIGYNLQLLNGEALEFNCIIEVEETPITLRAQIEKMTVGEHLYKVHCETHKYEYPLRVMEHQVPVYVKKGDVYRVDNKGDITVTLYNCSVGQSDCSRCQALPPEYQCLWCGEEEKASCVHRDQCEQSTIDVCPTPLIHSFSPMTGVLEGGTTITIDGANMGQKAEEVSVTVCEQPCFLLPDLYVVSNRIVCTLSASPGKVSGTVKVSVNGRDSGISSELFSYQDPILHTLDPLRGPMAGGTMITIYGSKLLTGDQITVTVGDLPCEVFGDVLEDQICCKTSPSPVLEEMSVRVLYGRTERRLEDLLYNYTENPIISTAYPSKAFYGGGRTVVVTGVNLDVVQTPRMSALVRSPVEEPPPGERRRRRRREFVPSPVQEISEHCRQYNSTVMLCISPSVPENSILVDILFVLDNVRIPYSSLGENFTYQKNPVLKPLNRDNPSKPYSLKPGNVLDVESKKAKRDYEKVLVQLENLETSVGDQCKKEFTDLVTEMMDLTSDIEGSGIPFLDYTTYTEKIFFPGDTISPLRKSLDVPESRRSTVEQGLTQLSNLLNNKLFLTKLIETLDAQVTLSQRDRCHAASLLTVALHGKLEYLTDVMKTLLCNLIDQCVAKNPKLLLRRTETIVEKLLTNWMSICLHSYLRVEWRSGQAGHLTLSDEDLTSLVQGQWKRLNTLNHYKVPDSATVTLIPRLHNNQCETPSNNYMGGEKTPMLEDGEDGGIRIWHLVKSVEEPEVCKQRRSSLRERERAKAIPEIYLTRLLYMKGTLQKFVDDTFQAMLGVNWPVPIAIKYFFDFLDEMAEKHGIVDKETVHIWKTHSLMQRFWVLVLKNPQMVFDIEVSENVDSILSVIAQTFIDSCTISEHKVGRDSPVNKLLYAREIPRYKQLVEKYYADIADSTPASYQEMNSSLTELSGIHSDDLNSLVALQELYNYINKYYDPISHALEEDPSGQKMQLAYRLQQISALVENKVTDL
ncbi:hypothetical protein GDO78_012992 [Eleutherodactylus coqui]|uniref:Sema domain-containing protein n=1 Tax=Eleutherodactylus coqui TaxID=57060 RepID=A0A8J6EXB0_ELECQ|nr:hypothetical protein GDO78_012992 [Eleutherodactylus coqui]